MVKIKFRNLVKCFLLLLLFLFLSFQVFALKQLLTLQGKVDQSGTLVNNGNLTVQIWDSASGGTKVYEDFFNNSIQNGLFDVMLGNGTVLDLNNSQTYYLDLAVNNTDLDFEGNERKIFQSPVGSKYSGTENFSVDTSTLFVDTLNNRIGVGISSPNDALEVVGNARISGSLNASFINATQILVNGFPVNRSIDLHLYNQSITNLNSLPYYSNFQLSNVSNNTLTKGDNATIGLWNVSGAN